MAIDNLHNGTNENPLSGAYIRTLVKQLTTSSKPNINNYTTQNLINNNTNDTLLLVPNYHNHPITSTSRTTTITTKKQAMTRPNHQRDQGHKKQVRRRLHTSRPYQERLLNMAEARKEIVTALKYHRASMKQANDRKRAQQNDQQQQQLECRQRDYYESGLKVKSEQLSVDNYGNYYPSDFDTNNHHNYNQNYSSNNISTSSPILYESLNNVPLPSQALGLNLNLQAFTNLDSNLCYSPNTTATTTTTTATTSNNNNNNPSSIMSPSSSPLSISSGTMAAMSGVGPTSGSNNNDIGGMDMRPKLDEEEMAKMRSIGEQYQIEWDDTLNLVKSAWWFNKFLKTVDFGKEMKQSYYNNNDYNDDDNNIPFGELREIPPWLSPINDESLLQQQHLHDSCSHDTTLPGMDIGDIDAMDDDWLS